MRKLFWKAVAPLLVGLGERLTGLGCRHLPQTDGDLSDLIYDIKPTETPLLRGYQGSPLKGSWFDEFRPVSDMAHLNEAAVRAACPLGTMPVGGNNYAIYQKALADMGPK